MNTALSKQRLLTELQSSGIRLTSTDTQHVSRRGGAGPSDHQAVTIDGTTIMVPVYTHSARDSDFTIESDKGALLKKSIPISVVGFSQTPRFYALSTAEGIPYSHIATLHSKDVLATTVLQTCIRYESRRKACKFCSIGQSLDAGRTVARKTPEQLAEVARAAVELDGIKHMVMTTGTPIGPARGADVLCDSAKAIKAAVNIPIQAQCEPPADYGWFEKMKLAGIDSLGMHLEVITPELRQKLMPGKAEVSLDTYYEAFEVAVEVFGRGQVSTYILAGLGDTQEVLVETAGKLIDLGVYPFVVPFVPIHGTPLEDHPPPSADFMESVLGPIASMLQQANMLSADIKAGCGRCGACSSLSSYERAETVSNQL
ncbi:MSMEG_0568 family radical SAM protein [Methylophaga sp.]|uniref:MSMEG_0568 family radical SAM protein n=1 Tax=Methylophaga sp. TaxID=2024840 RepID=UPI00272782A7|nr:MSMEG_0568 family radical SAM protein [Methylophaga sp.]MDO8827463.1 MSMEG_0568 family radical SAM protein [Methylophaga sp.]